MKCAQYFYFHGMDYYKSQTRIADLLSWKFDPTLYKDDLTISQFEIERAAFTFYEMASKDDGYSLYSMG